MLPTDTSRVLGRIGNPMIFNAFVIIAVLSFTSYVLHGTLTALQAYIAGGVLGFVACLTGWLNWAVWRNPRFLTYGPAEYLEESRMAHEERMQGKPQRGPHE